MRFSVSASQTADGTISASLYEGNDLVDKVDGLKDTKAVDKWAKGAAHDHKKDNLPGSSKSLSYSHTFSL